MAISSRGTDQRGVFDLDPPLDSLELVASRWVPEVRLILILGLNRGPALAAGVQNDNIHEI